MVGLFDRIQSRKFQHNDRLGCLTDMEGQYRLGIRLVRLEGNAEELMAGAEVKYDASDRLSSVDLALNLPPIPFTSPGRYEFQLLSNDIYIGRAVVSASELNE